jgi:hypothetical protein
MRIRYDVSGPKRKELVSVVSQELNAPAKYLGAPTFAYEVDDYSLDKNGILDGPDNAQMVENLLSIHGFKATEEDYDTPLQQTEIEEPEEPMQLIVQMPRSDFSDTALENLQGLIESKDTLIKKALGTDAIPIIVNEDIVSFPWFQGGCSADEIKAYTHFIAALCEMAKKQKRVSTAEKIAENEKYAFRCFLLRLGFIGAEFKTERKILLSKLSGSAAFKSGKATNAEVNGQ